MATTVSVRKRGGNWWCIARHYGEDGRMVKESRTWLVQARTGEDARRAAAAMHPELRIDWRDFVPAK